MPKKDLMIALFVIIPIILLGIGLIIYFLILKKPHKPPSKGCNTAKDCPDRMKCINKVCTPIHQPPPDQKCVYIEAWKSAPVGFVCSDEQLPGCKVKCCPSSAN